MFFTPPPLLSDQIRKIVWPTFRKKGRRRRKRSPFFPASGVIGEPWPYTLRFFWDFWCTFINWAYKKFLLIKFFSKNLKKIFDFFFIQRVPPLDFTKIEEKNFINKIFSYAQFMKVHRKSQKNLNVYGQAGQITPEAGKKKAPFWKM